MPVVWLSTLALALPISLGRLYGYEINPAFLLAPLIIWACLQEARSPLLWVFLAVAVGGLASIVGAHFIAPGNFKGNVVNLLVEGLFPTSFLFLGRALSRRYGHGALLHWLAVFSSVFLIVCAGEILVTGEPVRATNLDGTSFLNATFIGLPVYATFGINSLAPLFCIQTALILGSIYRSQRVLLAFFSLGATAGFYLALGSGSRSATISVLMLVPFAAIYAMSHLRLWRASTIAAACLVTAVTITSFGATNDRFVAAVHEITSRADATQPLPSKDADTLTTGRSLIWKAAWDEFKHSPIVGNGFSGFGRVAPADHLPDYVTENTTAHMFYLNTLWKGGILFGLPMFAFIVLAFAELRKSYSRPVSRRWIFGLGGVILMFTAPSITWDILIIPSAGALAWFVLGTIGAHQTSGLNLLKMGNARLPALQ